MGDTPPCARSFFSESSASGEDGGRKAGASPTAEALSFFFLAEMIGEPVESPPCPIPRAIDFVAGGLAFRPPSFFSVHEAADA